jgi:hypothetical protein
VIPRRVLVILVAALAVLLVSLAVTVAGYALVAAAQDLAAARVLWWIVCGILMVSLVDVTLIVGVLALKELDRGEDEIEH